MQSCSHLFICQSFLPVNCPNFCPEQRSRLYAPLFRICVLYSPVFPSSRDQPYSIDRECMSFRMETASSK